MPRKLKPDALGTGALFPHDLTITPEVLAIQASVTGAGQDMEWLWTWTTSSLPYSRVNITTQAQTSVPLYRAGTYQVDNFAGVELHSGMTQTHSLYLKWIEGAGTANLVPWVTYQNSGVTSSNANINSGATTGVQRLIINVPSNLTVPSSLTAPNISYNVTTTTGAWVFSGNAYGNNPNIGPFYRGGTYTFNLSNATGHPFYLTTDSGAGYVAGSYVGEYTSGVTNSRAQSGTVTFTVPQNAPDVLYYQCGNHSSMRGTIRIKNLAVEYNNNGNPIVYFQHSQDNHVTPVELRPLPSLVNQMCVVYDASTGKFVPQDLATYIERTPSFKNKIQEVAGTASLVSASGTATVASVKVYPYANYLPLLGNKEGDIAFTSDTGSLYIWAGSAWAVASGQLTPAKISDQNNTSTGFFDVPAGTTAQRPASPNVGMIRFNTDNGYLEQYTANSTWSSIEPAPTITNISPTSYNGDANTLITINGSNFNTGVSVKFIDAQNNEYVASNITRVSGTQITCTTPQDFTVAQAPLSIKVINASSLTTTLVSGLTTGSVPVFNTASGSLGTVNENTSINYSVSATDPDGGAITYSLVSGSLPSGVTLNTTTGAITGTAPAVTSHTTYNFTIGATDVGSNTTTRAFSITVNNVINITIKLWAAGGAGACKNCSGGSNGPPGGGGAFVSATTTSYQSGSLTIYVGGGGGNSGGGWPGGGNGGSSGGGGGGATYVYYGSTLLLVAGAGAGNGAGGGYPSGENGSCANAGTQSAGGAGCAGGFGGGGGGYTSGGFLSGGTGAACAAGGGGAGYYGGGGGTGDCGACAGGSGGGGSSYYNSSVMSNFNYSNASGQSAGGTADSDYTSGIGQGGGGCSGGQNGRAVIYLDSTKYVFSYTGGTQSLTIA